MTQITREMMDAGQDYLDRCVASLGHKFDLPAAFLWYEFWNSIMKAAPPPPKYVAIVRVGAQEYAIAVPPDVDPHAEDRTKRSWLRVMFVGAQDPVDLLRFIRVW